MTKSFTRALAIIAAPILVASVVHAQTQPPMDHSKMQHGQPAAKPTPAAPAKTAAPAPSGDAEATKAFKAANDRMHTDMGMAYTGNADVDFLKGMIPHHQGAIDMAKVVLQYGKDPKVRKLARDIIKAQEREIAMMKTWLAKKR